MSMYEKMLAKKQELEKLIELAKFDKKGAIDALNNEINELRKEIDGCNAIIGDLQGQIDSAKENIKLANERIVAKQNEIEEIAMKPETVEDVATLESKLAIINELIAENEPEEKVDAEPIQEEVKEELPQEIETPIEEAPKSIIEDAIPCEVEAPIEQVEEPIQEELPQVEDKCEGCEKQFEECPVDECIKEKPITEEPVEGKSSPFQNLLRGFKK